MGTTNNALAALDHGAGRPPRQNQWSIGLQRELNRNLVVEASYVGNRGVWWSGLGQQNLGLLNQVSPDTFAAYRTASLYQRSRQPASQLRNQRYWRDIARLGNLLPYAGYPTTSTLINTSAGISAVRQRARRIQRHGRTHRVDLLRFLAGQGNPAPFAWSLGGQHVHLVQVSGRYTGRTSLTRPAPIRSLQTTDQPFLFNVNILYTVPKAQFLDKWKAASFAARDWQIDFSGSYGSGALLTPPAATTTNNLAGTGTNQQIRVPGQPLYNKDLNCHCVNPFTDQVLNPLAWTNPAAGTFGPDTLIPISAARGIRPKASTSAATSGSRNG